MNALERITAIVERARIDGGWMDEDVAANVLAELGLDEDGRLVETLGRDRPTSSELGHG